MFQEFLLSLLGKLNHEDTRTNEVRNCSILNILFFVLSSVIVFMTLFGVIVQEYGLTDIRIMCLLFGITMNEFYSSSNEKITYVEDNCTIYM